MSSAGGPTPSKPNKVFVRKDPDAWKRKGWTSAPNSIIHESDMHPMEIWAWIWLASHSDTFELNAQALADANKHVGRDKAYKLVQALEDRGLLLRRHERSETGVPYIVYDLQPEPVPVEQRTTKTRKKATGTAREHPAKRARRSRSAPDSWRVRNPEPTSGNTPPQRPGLLAGQESGPDLHSPDPSGETPIPDPPVPDPSGEFYKEDKTNQQNQPTRADEPPPGLPGGTASNDGWLAEGNPETTPGGQLLRTLPLTTPLPKPVVRSYAGTADELLASGWPEQALVREFAGNIPSNTTNVVGLVIRRIERTNPKAAKTVKPQAELVQARIDALVRQGEAGARMADQILGTRDWHEPERGDLDARTYLVEVLPTAARAFVEARRAALADAMTNNPAWRN